VPLHLLVPSVVFGVVLVIGLTWAAGWTELAALDESSALERWSFDHPESVVQRVVVARDRRAALVRHGSGTGLVFVVGDRWATRDVRAATAELTADGVLLRFPEFGNPRVMIGLDHDVWREVVDASAA
jgi:hypothetical protein